MGFRKQPTHTWGNSPQTVAAASPARRARRYRRQTDPAPPVAQPPPTGEPCPPFPVDGALITRADSRGRIWCGGIALAPGPHPVSLGSTWLHIHGTTGPAPHRTVDPLGRLCLRSGDLARLGRGPLLVIQNQPTGLILVAVQTLLPHALADLIRAEGRKP